MPATPPAISLHCTGPPSCHSDVCRASAVSEKATQFKRASLLSRRYSHSASGFIFGAMLRYSNGHSRITPLKRLLWRSHAQSELNTLDPVAAVHKSIHNVGGRNLSVASPFRSSAQQNAWSLELRMCSMQRSDWIKHEMVEPTNDSGRRYTKRLNSSMLTRSSWLTSSISIMCWLSSTLTDIQSLRMALVCRCQPFYLLAGLRPSIA